MNKFKHFKHLLLLFVLAFTVPSTWATSTDYWGYAHLKITCEPTGAGKVYGSSKKDVASDPNKCTSTTFDGDISTTLDSETKWYVNTVPTNSQQYQFVGWKKEGESTFLSTDAFPENGIPDVASIAAVSNSNGTGSKVKKSDSPYYKPSNYSTTYTLKLVAVYEEIINQYISVESENAEYITATIDQPDNQMGDVVTIFAHPISYVTKFKGWKKDGVLIADETERMENPKTITVTEATQGTYTATYETGYKFFRLENKATGRVINGVNDQGSITDYSSLQLVNNDSKIPLAGTVVEISTGHVSGGTPYYFTIQGFNSNSYYDESTGVYVTMMPITTDNTYYIQANRQPVYMADQDGTSVEASSVVDKDIAHWYVNGMDKDLETCENYFSLDPAKLVQVGDKYYTTLRTSWNILFNPEQMTPYVVTSIDETAGSFEMEPVTGEIIPKNTPVIIETSSNDVVENRMVPTTTGAASGAVPSGNLLQSSVKYFPNQSVSTSGNYKGLMVKNGLLTFGGNAKSSVNGNEAYLCVTRDVSLLPEVQETALAGIEDHGVLNQDYTIADQLLVVYAKGASLWCKDLGNESVAKTEMNSDQVDYMNRAQGLGEDHEWDQSNWVELKFPYEGNEPSSDLLYHLGTYVGKVINPATVTATLTDKLNYSMAVKSGSDLETTTSQTFSPNVYCPANFLSKNLNLPGQTPGKFYFVNPKVQERVIITYAVWMTDEHIFVMPARSEDGQTNANDFDGAFAVDWDYNKYGNMIEALDAMGPDQAYRFEAIVRRTDDSANGLRREPGKTGQTPEPGLMVYPTNLNPSIEGQIITALADVRTVRKVASVEYYNVAGMRSSKPHEGINIEVTRYTDGTIATKKVVR